MKNLLGIKYFKLLFFILVSALPFLISVVDIYSGRIAFWFDPARDFLLALQNLKNPTLIGQPSGLPGLFYGPYWIWTISVLMVISKDPKLVTFLLLTVPYFTFFPFILYKITKEWGLFIFLSIWFLFIFNFGSYATQIWNVHYVAIFFLLAVYFFLKFENKKLYKYRYLLTGISLGILTNFHLSFGIPTVVGFFITIIIIHVLEEKKLRLTFIKDLFIKLFNFTLGVFLAFTPFVLFEIKHNFIQLKTFITAVTDSIVYNSATVGQTGMTDNDILNSFFSKLTDLLGIDFVHLPYLVGVILILIHLVPLITKTNLKIWERKLLILLFMISLVILFTFVFNENPTWGYYFIGVELIFVLLIGLIFSKLYFFKFIILIFIFVSLINHKSDMNKMFLKNNYTNLDLGARTNIVKKIFQDADRDFYYYSYSSAIYTYEYDYLFQWIDKRNERNVNKNSNLVYLIIPKVEKAIKIDFINNKAPSDEYETRKVWNMPDGSTIMKMVRK